MLGTLLVAMGTGALLAGCAAASGDDAPGNGSAEATCKSCIDGQCQAQLF